MHFLRTPDECFQSLPDYSFAPHYAEVSAHDGTTLRMHYLDEGNPNGKAILLLHGEPSWSYLYRKMIPILVKAGFRVLAPDLIGFGRSDKPTQPEDYSYQQHVDWLMQWFDQRALNEAIMFCQDWGGLLGLRLLAEKMENFSHVVAANTVLPTGNAGPNPAFLQWQNYSQTVPDFPVGKIIMRGCARPLSSEVQAAYDAPFPNDSYKVGARRFPILVPTTPDDPASEPNRIAWKKLQTFSKPFLTLFSDRDPIMYGIEKIFQKKIPGTQGQPHHIIQNAGHFLQEDAGEELAERIIHWLA